MIASRRMSVGAVALPLALLPVLAGCPGSGGGLDPNLFNSCSDLVNTTAVQTAIAALNTAGIAFPIYTESTPPTINGGWDIASGAVTRNQTGVVNFPLPEGRDTFANQAGGTLGWTTLRGGTVEGVSLRGFIGGTSARFSVCMLIQVIERNASTNAVLCSRQMAFFYTLQPNSGVTELTGTFLAVNLVNLSDVGTGVCLQEGDWVYGNITLHRAPEANAAPVLQFVRTVSLGTRVPESLALLPNGSGGFVGTSTAAVVYFNASTGATNDLTLPTPNTFTGVGPVSVSSDGGRVAFATEGDTRLLVYGTSARNLVAHIVPPTLPSPGRFPALPVLMPTGGDLAYAGLEYQNQRPGFAFFDSIQGSNAAGITNGFSFTNDGLRHIIATPNGGQLVALLNGAAVGARSRFCGFMNSSTGAVNREVDLTSFLQVDVFDRLLASATDGSRVWLTTGPQLVIVNATTGAISTQVLPENSADEVVQAAPSPDGAVLLASMTSSNNRSNFAIANAATSAILERRFLNSLAVETTRGQVVFFGGSRVGVIVSGPNGIDIVPINTLSPYNAGAPVQAAAAIPTANTVGIATAGRLVAIANAAERNVYIYRLASP